MGYEKSAGPATTVLLGIDMIERKEAKLHFGQYFEELSLGGDGLLFLEKCGSGEPNPRLLADVLSDTSGC